MALKKEDENLGEQVEVVVTPLKEFFYSDTSNWGSYRIESTDFIPHFEKGYNMDMEETYIGGLSGNMQNLDLGSTYRVQGIMTHHIKYGWSIKPTTVLPNVPKTIKQQQQFLESIITPLQSQTILEHYPNIVEDVINDNVDIDFDLLKGITPKKFEEIRIKISDNFVISDVLAMLSPLGVTFAMVKKLADFETNPVLLRQKLAENPYMLTRIKGLGFKKVDCLALSLNKDLRVSKFRAIAYIKYRLKEVGDDEGHVWVTKVSLRENFINNVPECEEFFDEILSEQTERSTFLHVDGNTLGLKSRYELEENIYDRLVAIGNSKSECEITEDNIVNGIKYANEEQGFEYDDDQVATIRRAVKSKVIVLSGNAGTSKSTTSRGILNVFKNAEMSISCCALSAKAKKVIESSTGFEASTIHRLFGIGVKRGDKNADADIMCDVLMIDECSMINSYLFSYVLSHVGNKTILLLVGDDKQLPPIGYGSVLRDLLNHKDEVKNISENVYVKQLTNIYRQANDSGIIRDANIIRQNRKPFDKMKSKMISGVLKDMFYIFNNDKEDLHKEAISKYLSAVEKNGIDNVIMTCPINKNSINSSETFNTELQDLVLGKDIQYIAYGANKYKLGAKVMQVVNDYEKDVMNGEEGYITKILDKGCIIEFKNGHTLSYTRAELANVQLSYCVSCHRMQGSSSPTVICVMDNSSYKLLDSCLLYTAITRAKERCMLISTPFAFEQCIRTNNQINRQTYLNEFLANKD